jgi:hypothetical protein
MPNWCSNRIDISGSAEAIARFKAQYLGERGVFFNKVRPMPEELNIVSGGGADIASEILQGHNPTYEWFLARRDSLGFPARLAQSKKVNLLALHKHYGVDAVVGGLQYIKNIAKFGCPSWYEWRIINWGTKWEVGDEGPCIETDEPTFLELQFDTAWGPAVVVYAALVAQNPDLDFEGWFLEAGNNFAGRWYGAAGEYTEVEGTVSEVGLSGFGYDPYEDEGDDEVAG